MPKILIGIFLVLIGFAGCVGGPFLLAMKLLPEKVVDVQTSPPTRIEVHERGRYFLRQLVDVSRVGGRATAAHPDLPDGEYGFRVDGGPLIALRGDIEINAETAGLGFIMVGSVDLEPGRYEVVVPPLPDGVRLDVAVSKALASESSLRDMGFGALAAMGGGALLGVSGIVLLILGIIQVSRKPARGAP